MVIGVSFTLTVITSVQCLLLSINVSALPQTMNWMAFNSQIMLSIKIPVLLAHIADEFRCLWGGQCRNLGYSVCLPVGAPHPHWQSEVWGCVGFWSPHLSYMGFVLLWSLVTADYDRWGFRTTVCLSCPNTLISPQFAECLKGPDRWIPPAFSPQTTTWLLWGQRATPY